MVNVQAAKGGICFSAEKDEIEVRFHRTLRLPEDGKTHALPPSIGHFPVKMVDDFKKTVPPSWVEHGGIFIPMWQREALWISFHSAGRPVALKVAAGKINAVSGKPWTQEMQRSEEEVLQDYLVAPPQPWLDGFNSGDAVIKQFVAMPLGMGYTVEKQLTGKEDVGGLQMCCFFPKAGLLEDRRKTIHTRGVGMAGASFSSNMQDVGEQEVVMSSKYLGEQKKTGGVLRSRGPGGQSVNSTRSLKATEMGLAAGGSMKQKIFPDPFGYDTWDQGNMGRLFIHIVNSQMYEEITGEKAPASPISAQTYTQHGYPWFELYDEGMGDVKASSSLAGVKTISDLDKDKGFEGQQDDSPVEEKNIVKQHIPQGKAVRDGSW